MRSIRVSIPALMLLVILLSSPAAAQAPRAAPANDNWVDAQTAKLGKNYTVLDIGAATNELNEPDDGCYASGPIRNSVWYRVDVSVYSLFYFGVDGYLYSDTGDSYDTTLALYAGNSIETLTPLACGEDSSESYLEMWYAGVGTFYVAVGTYADVDYNPNSSLNVVTRLLSTSFDLDNSGFEAPIEANDWKVKDSTGDEIVCNDLNYPATSGDCAFKFAGGAGESSKLIQSVPIPDNMLLRKGGIVWMSYRYQAFDASLGSAKVKLIVVYSEGTPPSARTVNHAGTGPMISHDDFEVVVPVASRNIAALKIKAVFKSTTGVLLVDNFRIDYYAQTGTRGGALPLPAPLQ